MKKIISLIFIITFSSIFLFAKSAEVKLNTSIDEIPLTYGLYRNIDNNLTLIEDGETYIIDDLNPLFTNTMITDFTIRVNSNLNSSKNVKVNVTPGTFKTVLNNSEVYDSKLTPKINTIINRPVVEAGINKNKEVYRFNIFVVGRNNLPAGIYVCNVDVEYTIE